MPICRVSSPIISSFLLVLGPGGITSVQTLSFLLLFLIFLPFDSNAAEVVDGVVGVGTLLTLFDFEAVSGTGKKMFSLIDESELLVWRPVILSVLVAGAIEKFSLSASPSTDEVVCFVFDSSDLWSTDDDECSSGVRQKISRRFKNSLVFVVVGFIELFVVDKILSDVFDCELQEEDSHLVTGMLPVFSYKAYKENKADHAYILSKV